MPSDLRELLVIVAVALPIGLVIGFAIRRYRPAWRGWLTTPYFAWWVYAAAAGFFIVLTVLAVVQEKWYRGATSAVLCLLEAYMAGVTFVKKRAS